MANEIKRYSFQPGAMSIIQMGEELIGHPSTAVNELVKNGYDADSLNCKVYFHYHIISNKSFALIVDDGNGMDEATLFGSWLHPSVSTKRHPGALSEVFHRHYLGSKGIGRLASLALGQNITVITKKGKDQLYNWLSISRDAFKKEKLLSEIDFPGSQIENFCQLFISEEFTKARSVNQNIVLNDFLIQNSLNSFQSGTIIVVEYLDDAVKKILHQDFIENQSEIFDKDAFRRTDFYKSLATLITPLNISSDIQKELLIRGIIDEQKTVADNSSEFSVHFGTNLLPDQEGLNVDWQLIEPIPIHSVFDYRVFGKVSKSGSVDGFFEFKRIEDDEHEERFFIDAKEVKDNSLSGISYRNESQDSLFPEIINNEVGEYYFDIRVYDIGEKENLEKLRKKANFDSVSKFKNTFKYFQGLRVSKNGFGVKPYGEEVEDWVGLSKARVQNPGQNVNTNQILGYVFFYSPENDKLEEKTNREGFLENSAFFQVKRTLLVIFKSLGRKRYNYRALHGLGRPISSKHSRPDFSEFLNFVNNNDNLKEIRSYSARFLNEVTTSMDNLEESLSFSERLASLGSGIELVYHEMAQPISRLKSVNSSLKYFIKDVNEELKQDLEIDIENLGSSTDTLIELRSSLQPAIGKSRKRKFHPYQTFLKVCSLFKTDIQEQNISLLTDEKVATFEINDLEYPLWIAFLNIINNAVYWIKKSERDGLIRLYLENNSIVISNSGPKIREDIIDLIFHYGVTTRHEKNATGLGLAYTQSILSANNWEIQAVNREDGPAFILNKVIHE